MHESTFLLLESFMVGEGFILYKRCNDANITNRGVSVSIQILSLATSHFVLSWNPHREYQEESFWSGLTPPFT